jgi:hypothetical protein
VTGCAAQNLYAPDHSDVCLSAAHAGLLTSAGGTFEVKIANAGIDYQGCTSNGLYLICDHVDLHLDFI